MNELKQKLILSQQDCETIRSQAYEEFVEVSNKIQGMSQCLDKLTEENK